MTARVIVLALLAVATAACGASVTTSGFAAPSGAAAVHAQTCTPTDQDQYVYRPARLGLLATCIRVSGTIVATSTEADGDVHINVRLDPAYAGLLADGNAFEDGYLIAEPVCQIAPPQADAIRICASDPDPMSLGIPAIGAHVWLEGRYVLDLQHHAWAELHPLYRWGAQP